MTCRLESDIGKRIEVEPLHIAGFTLSKETGKVLARLSTQEGGKHVTFERNFRARPTALRHFTTHYRIPSLGLPAIMHDFAIFGTRHDSFSRAVHP